LNSRITRRLGISSAVFLSSCRLDSKIEISLRCFQPFSVLLWLFSPPWLPLALSLAVVTFVIRHEILSIAHQVALTITKLVRFSHSHSTAATIFSPIQFHAGCPGL
jgi:hypothetical protein